MAFWLSFFGLSLDILGVTIAARFFWRLSESGRRKNCIEAIDALEKSIVMNLKRSRSAGEYRAIWREKMHLPIMQLYIDELATPARTLGLDKELETIQEYLRGRAKSTDKGRKLQQVAAKMRSELSENWNKVPPSLDIRRMEKWGFLMIITGFFLQLLGLVIGAS